jgi:hypothetical protein
MSKKIVAIYNSEVTKDVYYSDRTFDVTVKDQVIYTSKWKVNSDCILHILSISGRWFEHAREFSTDIISQIVDSEHPII